MVDKKRRKEIRLSKYYGVFVVSALIFFLGISLGQKMSEAKIEKIDEVLEDLRTQLAGAELQYILTTKNPCDSQGLTELAKELDELGNRIDNLERVFGKEEDRVLRLSNYYSTLQIRHWLLSQEINDQCEDENKHILYFYSNEEGICDECEEQGNILSLIRKNDKNLFTYAFNINLNNLALNTIKANYNLTGEETPILVIEDIKYTGFKKSKELESIIYEKRLEAE